MHAGAEGLRCKSSGSRGSLQQGPTMLATFCRLLERNPPPSTFSPRYAPALTEDGRLRVDWLNGFWRGAARAEDAQGTPIQSHLSTNLLAYEENLAHRQSIVVALLYRRFCSKHVSWRAQFYSGKTRWPRKRGRTQPLGCFLYCRDTFPGPS